MVDADLKDPPIQFELTPRELEIWRLHKEGGLPVREIAAKLGIGERNVQRHIRSAETKVDANYSGAAAEGRSLDSLKLENAAKRRDLIGGKSDPMVLSPDQRSAIEAAMADASPASRIATLERAQAGIIARLDNVDLIAAVPFERLPKMLHEVTAVLQLQKGEPTAIIKIQDVRKLDEIGKMLLDEAKRRGVVIEGEVVSEKSKEEKVA